MTIYRSNCLIEAIIEYRRLRREWVAAGKPRDGKPYVWRRGSWLAPEWVPHFGVEQYGVKRSFCPVRKGKLRWTDLWRVVIFEGRWVDGDGPPPDVIHQS